jgi:hypothetical protein
MMGPSEVSGVRSGEAVSMAVEFGVTSYSTMSASGISSRDS